MAEKNCSVPNCTSSSERDEDVGVTYHKFPKSNALRNTWMRLTKTNGDNKPAIFVCSRHFRKSDFQSYDDTKYVLKSDAIPSIFPWTLAQSNADSESTFQMEAQKESVSSDQDSTLDGFDKDLSVTVEASGENLEAIKKFIEEQEKEISILQTMVHPVQEVEVKKEVETSSVETLGIPEEQMNLNSLDMSVILDTETKSFKSECIKMENDEKADTIALSIGSKVEAKDYSEKWHLAEIVEVDYDDKEVLVHYETGSNKHDEWIHVSSPRLRPTGSAPIQPDISAIEAFPLISPMPIIKEEPKTEKPKLKFQVGERCYARWRDNRRFMATVIADLGDGKYEISFDDGFHWTCELSRLYKMKEGVDSTPVPYDVPSTSATNIQDLGPTTKGVPPTHLFDPARDYLGSKRERRELKRKLNIKEIFNIGQKKKKEPVESTRRPKILRKPKPVAAPVQLKVVEAVQPEAPDAVAEIVGAIKTEETSIETEVVKDEPAQATPVQEIKELKLEVEKLDISQVKNYKVETDDVADIKTAQQAVDPVDSEDEQMDIPQIIGERVEIVEVNPDEVLDNVDEPQVPEHQEDIKLDTSTKRKKDKKKEIKKAKKLRLLQKKKVSKEVEKVRNELEAMKRQVEEMKLQVQRANTQDGKKRVATQADLLPGEWSCKWLNGQPVGQVSELEADPNDVKLVLPRRSVQVEDHRLPPNWTKHMVRRSYGNSAGKWDVVLISPDNKRIHTKTDMKNYLETLSNAEELKSYEDAILDFGVHRKLAKRLGWDNHTTDEQPVQQLPAGTLCTTSPLVKSKKFSLIKKEHDKKQKKLLKKRQKNAKRRKDRLKKMQAEELLAATTLPGILPYDTSTLQDGYVTLGSLKVQVIDNLLRCPAEGCFKNFRNNTLLQMHIKHYHRELKTIMGDTPKVSDLASARAIVPGAPDDLKTPKIKVPKHKHSEETKVPEYMETQEIQEGISTPFRVEERIPRSQDSPRLRNALMNKLTGKRPKVLLPVRRLDIENERKETEETEPVPELAIADFEAAISTHTVTKADKKGKRRFASVCKATSEDEDWANSDFETRSSFPRSGTPDSKVDKYADTPNQMMSSESNEGPKEEVLYTYTETGERIRIEHMKREEIINCHCGVREEDGLMIQCELCLCWQHALCHNIHREIEVPDKYTCSICLNPRRGRRSQRFLHDQDRLYEGLLPGARSSEALRRSHELSGNLIRISDALHSLRVKCHVAAKKDHPKLYLWASEWDTAEPKYTDEKLTNDYMDLNTMISEIGKENLPIKPEDISLEIRTPPSEEVSEGSQKDSQLGSQALLSGLLSGPGGVSLDLPISTSELETLAKSVQAESETRPVAPQPEAAIENSVCRERLLKHIERCQALIDQRLDTIEAQVVELEGYDPPFESDETAEYFPRTKQTIQMLMRDLDTMEELGVNT